MPVQQNDDLTTRSGVRQAESEAPALFKGELTGMEPASPAGIIAILIGLRQADAFEFRGSGIITTNEHASSTLFDAVGGERIIVSTDENADSTVIAGIHAGGGWDPTSIMSPRDAASGLMEHEWLHI